MYASFLDKLSTLKNISSKWDETWVSLTIEGTYSETINKSYFEDLWRTRQTLWRAVQMLTQKLSCQTIHDCPKVVPLHYESEWQ